MRQQLEHSSTMQQALQDEIDRLRLAHKEARQEAADATSREDQATSIAEASAAHVAKLEDQVKTLKRRVEDLTDATGDGDDDGKRHAQTIMAAQVAAATRKANNEAKFAKQQLATEVEHRESMQTRAAELSDQLHAAQSEIATLTHDVAVAQQESAEALKQQAEGFAHERDALRAETTALSAQLEDAMTDLHRAEEESRAALRQLHVRRLHWADVACHGCHRFSG